MDKAKREELRRLAEHQQRDPRAPALFPREILALLDHIERVEAEAAAMREALVDFRDHGVRHDMNPTGTFHDCGHFTVWEESGGWHAYLKSADQYVRQKSAEALAPDAGSEWLTRYRAMEDVVQAARGMRNTTNPYRLTVLQDALKRLDGKEK